MDITEGEVPVKLRAGFGRPTGGNWETPADLYPPLPVSEGQT